MSRLSLVVCDLAGTLVDDGGAVLNAYADALTSEDVAFDLAALVAARGGNKLEVIQRFVAQHYGAGERADTAVARAYARFDQQLADFYRDGPLRAFDGVAAALEELRGQGLKLATNTGFPGSLAAIILARLGWLHEPFAAHVAGDEVPAGRPAPYMIQLAMQRTGVLTAASVLVVGDTPLDLRAGVNAGAAGVVGVLTGSHDVAALGSVRHTHLLPAAAGLPALIAAEFAE